MSTAENIASARAALRKAEADLDALQGNDALAASEAAAQGAAAEAVVARNAYESAAADMALAPGDAALAHAKAQAEVAADDAQREAEAAARALAILRSGLARRHEATASAVVLARQAVVGAESAFLWDAMDRADADYAKAAAGVDRALRRVMAIRQMLSNRSQSVPPCSMQLPSFTAAGRVSAAAVLARWPHLDHGWSGPMFASPDWASERLVVEAEMTPFQAPAKGSLARARNALAD